MTPKLASGKLKPKPVNLMQKHLLTYTSCCLVLEVGSYPSQKLVSRNQAILESSCSEFHMKKMSIRCPRNPWL